VVGKHAFHLDDFHVGDARAFHHRSGSLTAVIPPRDRISTFFW
jgi:hypothetical protein